MPLDLQPVLDDLVTGAERVAPGVTRPGLLPYGKDITIRQLISDMSGLVDDNDIATSPAELEGALGKVDDRRLRTQLSEIFARVSENRATPVDPVWLVRMAAWQPLVLAPGTGYHHSNIGWNIAGLVTERVTGVLLPALYEQRIFAPLGLRHSSYQPQGLSMARTRRVTSSAPTEASPRRRPGQPVVRLLQPDGHAGRSASSERVPKWYRGNWRFESPVGSVTSLLRRLSTPASRQPCVTCTSRSSSLGGAESAKP